MLDMFDLNMSQSYLIVVWVVVFLELVIAQVESIEDLEEKEKSG
jgi:hypothetical protein